MPGGFPQAAIEQLRALDLEIAGGVEPHAHVILDDAEQPPALRMPEDAADRLLADVEQVELAAEPAMVAALGLFELKEVLVELLLARKGGAVDALQLGIFRVAAPIRAGDVHQLEGLAEITGRGQMRADAEIDEIALPVEADLLVSRDFADIFGLVGLADAVEEGDRGVAVPDLARDLLVAAHDLAHARLDLLEILGSERLGAREIVIEPGLGRRPEGDLGVGIQFLDRLRHDMGRIVAQNLEPFRHLPSDDRDGGVMVDHGREIARPAVDPNGDRRLRQTRPDRGGDFGAGDRTGKFEAFAVRQGHAEGA